MIRFEQVSKAYLGGRQALQGVDFHLRPAEMAFLTGHSGAGKSTLLKLICGIERPSAGHIWFGGHDISRLKNREVPFLRRQIGMIFQDHHLLLDRTVYDNVAMPLIIAGASTEDIRRRVSAALDKVGLLDKAKNFPIQLSGGEQQRVGIARAVVNKPAVLLADEPTGNLDDALSEGILRLFEEFNRVGVTVLMATHDTGLIARRNYRILTLSQGRMQGGAHHGQERKNRQEQGAARRLARTVALRLDERHQRHAAPAVGDAADGDGDRHLPDAAERVLHRVEKRQHRGQPVVPDAATDGLPG
jgi:cell division transport system ATP-binding protein